MIHTKEEINGFLSRAYFAVLSYQKEELITSQLMIFGHTIEAVFYLVSQNDKKLFTTLDQLTDVSVLIYKEEEDLSQIRQVYIQGKGVVIDFGNEEMDIVEKTLAEKSPLIQNAIHEKDKSLTVVKVEADILSSISFGEISKALSPITLKRV